MFHVCGPASDWTEVSKLSMGSRREYRLGDDMFIDLGALSLALLLHEIHADRGDREREKKK